MSPTHAVLASPHSAGLLRLAEEFDENKVTPGVLGFLVFAAMGLVIWFLMKSLNRRMQKVDFDQDAPAARPDAARTASRDG
ncbi:hypothetical protein V1J52_06415 [Streptomyces sp. TRM 70351]|uniref:hypothetical protein n=1 Tax=Streptomyces sp. TRM 70351 TaxID=3116552 RepID=UPI002E7C138C|nr:hypothetical protein [Streptomyces sp. TRM 70351]MEE1927828.1 hypothetical protein [Streptomyces sp. TRM 70351]